MKSLKNILLGTAFVLSLSSCNLEPSNLQPQPSNEFILDGNYPGVVIFCYKNNKESQEFINEKFAELITNQTINGNENEAVEYWYKEQAKKYNASIDIPLTLYNEQVQVPSEFVDETSAFPIDLWKLSDYLRNKDKTLKNYDFISYVCNESNGSYHGYIVSNNSFICNVQHCDDANYDKYLGEINQVFAHEFGHVLGASDKYGSEFDGKIDNWDLMRQYNQYNLDDKYKITEPTAVEIGW